MAVFKITGGALEGEVVSEPGPGDAHPEHPIVLPIPPDAIAPGVPTHPIYIPVYPAHPIVIPPDAIAPGVPAHPIYLPPGIWGGANEPFPTPPIYIPPDVIRPGVPAHPIYLPPTVWPPGSGIDVPAHPIVLPPDPPVDPPTGPPVDPPSSNWEWGWNPSSGWVPVYIPGDKPQPPGGA